MKGPAGRMMGRLAPPLAWEAVYGLQQGSAKRFAHAANEVSSPTLFFAAFRIG